MKCSRSATPPPASGSSANWNPAVQLAEARCSALITLRSKPTLSQQGGRKPSRGGKKGLQRLTSRRLPSPRPRGRLLCTSTLLPLVSSAGSGDRPLRCIPPARRTQRHAAGTGNCASVGPSGWAGVARAQIPPYKQGASWVPLRSCSQAVAGCSQARAAAPVLSTHLPELRVRSSHALLNPGAPFPQS